MNRKIYIDSNLYKNFAKLRRSGKKASQAKDKAEQIIARLQAGEEMPDQVGTMTKHGELRIKGVVKYDLGGGYRMISMKRGRRFFLLFIGTHDDCHRWIENNRELTIGRLEDRCIPLPRCRKESGACPGAADMEVGEQAEDPLASIDERLLRRVFCGLVSGE